MEVTLASLWEPRPELGQSRKIGHTSMPSTGSFDIKHPSHFGLSFRKNTYVLSQNLAWLPRVGRQEQIAAALGLDAILSAAPLADWALTQVDATERFFRGPPSPHTALSVTLVLGCLCGTKMHFSSWGKICLFCQAVPMCPSSDCFFWLRP